MNIEEAIKELEIIIETIRNILELDTSEYKEEIYTLDTRQFEALENLLIAYEKEKEKNKNKDKILRNIRDEFLKYNWKDANPIQTYNQIKGLYESIYCKPYED